MKKIDMYNKILEQAAFYLGNVNYARCGYASDNAKFAHDAFQGYNAIAYYAETIGLLCETVLAKCDGVVFYAGIRYYSKDHKYDACRWCTSCDEVVDHLTYMAFQDYKIEHGIE